MPNTAAYSWISLHVLHRLLARKCRVGWKWKPWLLRGSAWHSTHHYLIDATILWPFVQVGKEAYMFISLPQYRGAGVFLADFFLNFILLYYYSKEQWPYTCSLWGLLALWNDCLLSSTEVPWGFLQQINSSIQLQHEINENSLLSVVIQSWNGKSYLSCY